MKFSQISSYVLASLLAAVTVQASGPAEGEARADPNSAVVQLTTEEYKSFIDSNPLVLAEFYASWCGYCKQLAPEFAKAANSLNTTNPNIKLAQVDCTVEEDLCMEQNIRGYPTMKVIRGSSSVPEDYEGPRTAEGIVDYMVTQSKPAVEVVGDVSAVNTVFDNLHKAAVIQLLPADYNGAKDKASANQTFSDLASQRRKEVNFVTVQDADAIDALIKRYPDIKAPSKAPSYVAVQPKGTEAVTLPGDFSKDALSKFITTERVPYFGDINQDSYLSYMTSPLPLAYYFYNTAEEREAVADELAKLGKQHRGKINFVGLDASKFGRHAEVLSMDPEIVPLFAIQNQETQKKYGVDQKEHPNPSVKVISEFVEDYFAGKLSPIIKSQPLPTPEEIAAESTVKLVAHNYQLVLDDTSKDIFVKYFADWCGHCKLLAPTWEELASIFESNKPDSKVVIAKLQHPENDVDTPIPIEGYPTLLFFPANGEVNEKGMRVPIVFNGQRDLDSLITFVKENGYHKLDGHALKEAKSEVIIEEEEDAEEVAHDEL